LQRFWEEDFIATELLEKGTIRIKTDNPFLLEKELSGRSCALVVSATNHGGPDLSVVRQAVSKLKPQVLLVISDEKATCPEFDSLIEDVAYYGRQYCHASRNPQYRRLRNVNYIPLGYMNDTKLTEVSHVPDIKSRKHHWGFVGRTTHGGRRRMLETFTLWMGTGDVRSGVPPAAVSECYLNCIFVPQGRGGTTVTCFRHFEASMAGAIPVLCFNTEGDGARDNAVEIQDLIETMDNPPWLVFDTWEEAAKSCQDLLMRPIELQRIQDSILKWWEAMMAVRKTRILLEMQQKER